MPDHLGSTPTGVAQPRAPIALFAILSILILASQIPMLVQAFGTADVNGHGGADYRLYMDATQRWLHGGPFYQPYQLVGPYQITHGDVLYPPVALWLFVPFTFLPAALWWIAPIATTALVIWRLRPGFVAWPLLALCAAWPPTLVKLVSGNPVIWVMAAMALGCLYRWPSVFVLLKPSLFPFAAFGANRRSWWVALGFFAILCLPFGAMWQDWFTALLNARGAGLGYSVQEVQMLLLPLIAWWWAGSTDPFGRPWRRQRSP